MNKHILCKCKTKTQGKKRMSDDVNIAVTAALFSFLIVST